MELTVLSIAYPFEAVRPDMGGGPGQVLGMLDVALKKRGYRSIVVPGGGARVEGTVLEIPVLDKWGKGRVTLESRTFVRSAVEEILQREPVDVIHVHDLDYVSCVFGAGPPVLATLHLPLDSYDAGTFRPRPHVYYNCVSAHQERSARHVPNLFPFVEYGVPVDELGVSVPRQDFVLALGPICPAKAVHLAVDAAAQADVPVLVAGTLLPYRSHHDYYLRKFAPLFNGTNRKFLGPVTFETKRRLLASAKCLLVPSQVPETSSLVTMEAYACGTPVIASPSGALVDLVEHGKTGFLANTVDEMCEAIGRIDDIDREHCKYVARTRFSLDRMVDDYLALYETIINIYRADLTLSSDMEETRPTGTMAD
ncbi:MAG TPA: glycosyltransferase [Desulfomonilaceae bacterium]|nr:glycosyltransferase [Desulfomonilaceae bacterium]